MNTDTIKRHPDLPNTPLIPGSRAARGPGRPREDHVPTESGVCEVHGNVEIRLHKAGEYADGSQRYVRRCPPCHNEKVQGYMK